MSIARRPAKWKIDCTRCAGQTSSPEQLASAGALWRAHDDCLMQTHIAESRAEIAWIRELFPDRRNYLDVYDHHGLCGRRAVFGHQRMSQQLLVQLGQQGLNLAISSRSPAAVSAIKKLINEKVVLAEFLMQAITRGSNDVGRVHVQVECGSRTVHGFAAHTDTTRASIEAFLDALRALNVTEKIEEED